MLGPAVEMRSRCLGHGPARPHPPTNLYEYQRKGLTKIAFRKLLILKGAVLAVLGWQRRNGCPEKEKRELAPALHTQLSTGLSIARIKDL